MTGTTRQKVQLDLLGSQLCVQYECCLPDGSLSNSRHCTTPVLRILRVNSRTSSSMYQAISSVCCPAKASAGTKGEGKNSKGSVVDPVPLQARVTRAATERQIAGLLRMPTKGRPDFAQRVCLN